MDSDRLINVPNHHQFRVNYAASGKLRRGGTIDTLVIMLVAFLVPLWLMGHLYLSFYPPNLGSESDASAQQNVAQSNSQLDSQTNKFRPASQSTPDPDRLSSAADQNPDGETDVLPDDNSFGGLPANLEIGTSAAKTVMNVFDDGASGDSSASQLDGSKDVGRIIEERLATMAKQTSEEMEKLRDQIRVQQLQIANQQEALNTTNAMIVELSNAPTYSEADDDLEFASKSFLDDDVEISQPAQSEPENSTTSDLTTSDLTNSDLTNSDSTTSDSTTSDSTTSDPTTSDLTNSDPTASDSTEEDLVTEDLTTEDLVDPAVAISEKSDSLPPPNEAPPNNSTSSELETPASNIFDSEAPENSNANNVANPDPDTDVRRSVFAESDPDNQTALIATSEPSGEYELSSATAVKDNAAFEITKLEPDDLPPRPKLTPKIVFREWLSSRGSTASMAFVRWDGDQAILLDKNKIEHKMPLHRFSPADQSYLLDRK